MWNRVSSRRWNRVSIAVITSLLYVSALLVYYTSIQRPNITKSEWKRWQSNIVKHLNYTAPPDEPVAGFRDNVQRGKCNKRRFITVQDISKFGLGNQMNGYASLLSHSRRLGLTPFIASRMKEKLSAIFG